jgi:hypothetical protein
MVFPPFRTPFPPLRTLFPPPERQLAAAERVFDRLGNPLGPLTLWLNPSTFMLLPMKKAAKVLRHYSDPDATMRQNMRTMHEHYLTNQTAFQEFSPDFDPDFGTEWLAAINTADTTLPGSQRVGELKEDTSAVNAVMEQARAAVQTVFYYAGRAFPNNPGRLDQYGRRDYESARKNQDKMRTLLHLAFTTATRDKVALAAKGYGATKLAALGALEAPLTTADTDQEVQKGHNVEGSDHYVTVQNLAYGFGQEVSGASKLLFATEAAKLGLFRLSHDPSGPEQHELTVEASKEKSVAFTLPLNDDVKLRLRLFQPELRQRAEVSRITVVGEKPTRVVVLSPALDVNAGDLGPAGQLLLVQNTGEHLLRVEMTVLD